MVTIAQYMDYALADIVCGRLHAEGFNAFVVDGLSALWNEGGITGAQGVRIQVPDAEAEDATAFLRELDKQQTVDDDPAAQRA